MPPHPAFLSRVLRLQICDWYLCCCDAVAACAFRRAGKGGGLVELLAFRRLPIPARDTQSGGRGHDNPRALREHIAVIRTPARRIRRALTVGLKERRLSKAPCLLNSFGKLALVQHKFAFAKTRLFGITPDVTDAVC